MTVPEPAPDLATDNVYCGEKFAVTEVSAFNSTVQLPIPAQLAAVHPVNTEPAAADGVNVTEVPVL